MNKQKADEYDKFPISLPSELNARVREISRKTGIPVSVIIRQALQGNLKQYDKIVKQVEEIVEPEQ